MRLAGVEGIYRMAVETLLRHTIVGDPTDQILIVHVHAHQPIPIMLTAQGVVAA